MEVNKHRTFTSPWPGMSRFCLGMAAIAFTSILMARHHRDQTFEPRVSVGEYAFFWAKLIGAFAQAALLVIHGDLFPFEPFGGIFSMSKSTAAISTGPRLSAQG
ncbi:hypothetical protein PG997_011388 [Apiospora hydei]|uniref:Uncharacterized protein n=1 Tax=Apiospora hydei TaxID=1337664 RepID=A0ABR1VIX4_9PEZI